jgi:site-specific DNA-methyltransferase (adenine-specific)
MREPVLLPCGVLYNEDCVTGARHHIRDGSVDLIITDPPYGIGGDCLHRHYNRNERFVAHGYVEIPCEEYGDFSMRWVREAERILRPGGSLYIISGYTNLFFLLNALRGTGLCEVNHLIWKYSFGVFTRKKYVSSHYHILFYEKPGGKRTFHTEARFGLEEKTADGRSLNNQDREDVWIINREYKPGRPKNKNELPLGLLIKILQYSSNEGDLICDFFCGGFSAAKAAIGLNRRFVGFEISSDVFRVKEEDLRRIEPGFLLPSLRRPEPRIIRSQGKRWTEEERRRLFRQYHRLAKKGLPRKDIVQLLGETHGRGRWAIEKALKKGMAP